MFFLNYLLYEALNLIVFERKKTVLESDELVWLPVPPGEARATNCFLLARHFPTPSFCLKWVTFPLKSLFEFPNSCYPATSFSPHNSKRRRESIHSETWRIEVQTVFFLPKPSTSHRIWNHGSLFDSTKKGCLLDRSLQKPISCMGIRLESWARLKR